MKSWIPICFYNATFFILNTILFFSSEKMTIKASVNKQINTVINNLNINSDPNKSIYHSQNDLTNQHIKN